MKTLLINSIDNTRVVIDLSELSKDLSKSASSITFQDIVSRTVRDSRYWHLHHLTDRTKLQRLPENGRLSDFKYPEMLFWVQVAEAPSTRQGPPVEERYRVRRGGYYELGLRLGTFIEFLGLSRDIFRTIRGRFFWLASIISVLIGTGLSIYMRDYRIVIPFILIVPFAFYIRSGLRAIKLMREVWPQVKSRIHR